MLVSLSCRPAPSSWPFVLDVDGMCLVCRIAKVVSVELLRMVAGFLVCWPAHPMYDYIGEALFCCDRAYWFILGNVDIVQSECISCTTYGVRVQSGFVLCDVITFGL